MPSTKEVPGVEEVESPQPAFFLRLRTIALGCIMFLSFLWIILFCIIIFLQWDVVDHVERSIILIMLLLETFTLIMLPILLTRPFRPWLDAARVIFILFTHGGVAILFAVKSPEFKCIHSDATSANQDTVCTSLIIYLNIFNWLIPALAIVYGAGLVILMRNLSKQALENDTTEDIEKHASSSPSLEEDVETSTQSHESTLKKQFTLDSMEELPQTRRPRASSLSTVNKEKLKRHLTCDSIYEEQQASTSSAAPIPIATPASVQIHPAQLRPGRASQLHPIQPLAPIWAPPYAPPPPSSVKRNTRLHDSFQSQYTVSSYYGPSSPSRSTKTFSRDSYRAAYRVGVPSPQDSVPPTPTLTTRADKRMTNANIQPNFQDSYTINSTYEARQYAYAV